MLYEWLKKENYPSFADRYSKETGKEWLSKVKVNNCFYDSEGNRLQPFLNNTDENYHIDMLVPLCRTVPERSNNMQIFVEVTVPFVITTGYVDQKIGARNSNIPVDDPNYQQSNDTQNETTMGKQTLPYKRASILRSWLIQTIRTKLSDFYELHPSVKAHQFISNGLPFNPSGQAMNKISPDGTLAENVYQNCVAFKFEAFCSPETYDTYYYLRFVQVDVTVDGINLNQERG